VTAAGTETGGRAWNDHQRNVAGENAAGCGTGVRRTAADRPTIGAAGTGGARSVHSRRNGAQDWIGDTVTAGAWPSAARRRAVGTGGGGGRPLPPTPRYR
jgi:hypothetical protein